MYYKPQTSPDPEELAAQEHCPRSYRSVAIWLYLCCAAVFVMAIVGAITRLTGSGLSMVEWRPLMGALPPMSEAEWQRVFGLYQQSPEFQKVNFDMDLGAFKKIFFWEWAHRLMGRFIGVLYTLPFLWFLIRKRIPKRYLPSFFGFLLLGALQGLMGWYMVQSGLVDRPAVSHYRLAAHLGLAFLIFGLLFHMALKLSFPMRPNAAQLAPLHRHAVFVLFMISLTMVWGAFVAGLDAGLIYNSFPMMGDYIWPSEGLDMYPVWINFFENHAMVQFTHRCLAILTAFFALIMVARSHYFNPPGRAQAAFRSLGFLVLAQVGLGIMTLLSGVDIVIAVAHQGVAMLLLAAAIWVVFEVPHYKQSFPKL